jgi:hypothetical protein
MEVARIGVRVTLGPRPVVAKLEEPERPRLADDRAADLLPYLTRQSGEKRLGSLPVSARQDVGTVLIEHEDRPAWPSQDGAR